MTAIQFILIAIAAFIVLAGLYMVIRSFKRRNSADAPVVNYDKNGIPIIPRHERSIVDQPDLEDTVAGETSIGPDRSYLDTVVEQEPVTAPHNTETPSATAQNLADTPIAMMKTICAGKKLSCAVTMQSLPTQRRRWAVSKSSMRSQVWYRRLTA